MIFFLFAEIALCITIKDNIELNSSKTFNLDPYQSNQVQYVLNLTNVTNQYVGLELYSQQANFASAKAYATIDDQIVEEYFHQSSPNVIQCLLRTGNMLLGQVIKINISLTFIPISQSNVQQQFTFSAMQITYINYDINHSLQLQSSKPDTLFYTEQQSGIPQSFCIQLPITYYSQIQQNIQIFYSFTSLTAPSNDQNTETSLKITQTSQYSYACIDINMQNQKLSETILFRIRFNGIASSNSSVFLTFNSSLIQNTDILRPNIRKKITLQSMQQNKYEGIMIPLFYGQSHRKYSNISYAISVKCSSQAEITITDNTSIVTEPINNKFTCNNNVTHLFKLNLIDVLYISISGKTSSSIEFLYSAFANFFIQDLQLYLDTVLNKQVNIRMYLQTGFEQQLKLYLINSTVMNDLSLYISKNLIYLQTDPETNKYYKYLYQFNQFQQSRQFTRDESVENQKINNISFTNQFQQQPITGKSNENIVIPKYLYDSKTIQDDLSNILEKGWIYVSLAIVQYDTKPTSYGYYNIQLRQIQFNILQKPGINVQYRSFIGQKEINLKYTGPIMVSNKMMFQLQLSDLVKSAILCIDQVVVEFNNYNNLNDCYTFNQTSNISLMIYKNDLIQQNIISENTIAYRPRIFIYLNTNNESIIVNFGICQYFNLQEFNNGINITLTEAMEFVCFEMSYVRIMSVEPSHPRMMTLLKIITNTTMIQQYITINGTYTASFEFYNKYLLKAQFFNITKAINPSVLKKLSQYQSNYFSTFHHSQVRVLDKELDNSQSIVYSLTITYNSQVPYQQLRIGEPAFIKIQSSNSTTNQFVISKIKQLQYVVIETMFSNIQTSYNIELRLQNCTFSTFQCQFNENYILNNTTNIIVINTSNYINNNIYMTLVQQSQNNQSSQVRIRALDSNPTIHINQTYFFIKYFRQSKQCQLYFEIDHLMENVYEMVSIQTNGISILSQRLNLTYSLYQVTKQLNSSQNLSILQIQTYGNLIYQFNTTTQESLRTYDTVIFLYPKFDSKNYVYFLLLNASNGNEYKFQQLEVIYEQMSMIQLATIGIGIINIILLAILIVLGVKCRQKNKQFQEQNDQKLKLQKQ